MNQPTFSGAGWLAETFVTSRLTVLFMLACAVLGTLAILTTPREENPQLSVPSAEVRVALAGASAHEVEEQVLRPLEGIVKQMPGVDHVMGTAVNSMAVLTVQFKVGEDKERALIRLHDRVDGQRERLPADASVPLIRSIDVDDVAILALTLSSDRYDDHALKRLADRMMEGLRSVPDVSGINVLGGHDREVRVEIDPARLQAYALTLDDVRLAVQAGNVAAPVGTVVQQGRHREVFVDGFIRSAQALGERVVAQRGGRAVRLGDVAQVVDGPPDELARTSRFAYGPADARFARDADAERPAVTLTIAKKRGSNAVTVAQAVMARVAQMQRQFVPEGVAVEITRNEGHRANEAVNELMLHLGVAVVVVFVITALFLGLREAAIVGLTVPLVLGLTLFGVAAAGHTINRVTLFALIVALGLLVDDAIVVIENIHRRASTAPGHDRRALVVLAAREIGNPTNLATLAVMLVFGSLLVLSGVIGQFMHPLAFTVPVAMACSLLVAYVVVPWASLRWLKPHHGPQPPSRTDRLQQRYKALLDRLLLRRRGRLGLCMLALVAVAVACLQPAWQFIRPAGVGGAQSWLGVALTMLPRDNTDTFNITIDLPAGASVEATDRLAREIGQLLRTQPEVRHYLTWIGQPGVIDFNGLMRGSAARLGSHQAEIRVNLRDKAQRRQTSMQVVLALRPAVAKVAARYPGSTVQLVEDPPGPPFRATVLAELYGPDLAVLRGLSARVKAEFQRTYDMAEVMTSEAEDLPQVHLVVDAQKAAASGVSVADAAVALRRLISGEALGRVHVAGEKNAVPIRLMVPRRRAIDPQTLAGVWLRNAQGEAVALSALVRQDSGLADRTILHKDNERVSYVGGELAHSEQLYAVLDLDRRLDSMAVTADQLLRTGNLGFGREAPSALDGYRLLWDGELRGAMDTYRDMLVSLLLAIGLVFLILVAYYQSFLLPLVAMSAIPLSLLGVFPGHWLVGKTFSASSMIGLVALAGIVVRNSLLIIDFALERRAAGRPVLQAVTEAASVRLKPIVLTASAVMMGSAVMLTDSVFGGLAASLIFGTLASTGLSLLVVPALLCMVWRDDEPAPAVQGSQA